MQSLKDSAEMSSPDTVVTVIVVNLGDEETVFGGWASDGTPVKTTNLGEITLYRPEQHAARTDDIARLQAAGFCCYAKPTVIALNAIEHFPTK